MKIYQIFYNELSKSKISPHFIPFDNTIPTKPNEFEYGVMRKLYFDENTWVKNKHLGVLSWKFYDKTNVHPDKFTQWLKKNKGFDIYTCNPFAAMNKLFDNVWKQGDHFHPGMIDFAKNLCDRIGLDLHTDEKYTSKVCCYCNYWIANKRFWDLYISYTEKLYEECYKSEQEIIDKLFYIKADQQIDSGMFSFIFERMFSTILHKHQNEFKILPYYS